MLSKHSEVMMEQWKCEFCNENNVVTLEEEEFPKSEEMTYILESSQQQKPV